MVTIEQLEELSNKILLKREEIEKISAVKKSLDNELDKLESEMMMLLEQSGKTNYRSNVGTVTIVSRESVKTPKDLESKQAFFNYLREKGLFEEMVNVNSQTLNAFYRAEKKAADERGEWEFNIPGIGEPTVDQIISFRKA